MISFFTLPSGMEVLIWENHRFPVVTIDFWVKVGRWDEPPGLEGAAHFIEHLLFKGTTNRTWFQINSEIEGVGGILNAATSHDFTHFYATVPSKFWQTALNVLADILKNATIPPDELEKERKVVIEEIIRSQQNPSSFLFRKFLQELFKKSGYGNPVLGTVESIKNVKRKQLLDFYKQNYTPDNMIVVVAGDVNPKEFKKKLKELFPKAQRSKLNRKKPKIEPSSGEIVIKRDVKLSYIVMGTTGPPGPSGDQFACDLLAHMLGGSKSSYFYKILKEEKGLAKEVSFGFLTLRQAGVFYLFMLTEHDKVKEAVAEAKKLIKNLKKWKPDDAMLKRAKRVIKISHYLSAQSAKEMASGIGFYTVVCDNPDYFLKYDRFIERVSKRKIKSMIKKYLLDKPWLTVIITDKEENGEKG